MTTCYNCGGTNGAHDPACPAVKNATPPAMNAASPTDEEKDCRRTCEVCMDEWPCAKQRGRNRAILAAPTTERKPLTDAEVFDSWQKTGGIGAVYQEPVAAPVGQGSANQCGTCDGNGVVGSPPDQYFDCHECAAAQDQGSATSDEAVKTWIERYEPKRAYYGNHDTRGYMQAEIDDLRAALAAKAEQSNTAGAAKGGNTCDLPCQCCYGSGRVYDEQCNDCGGTGNYTATPVAERAAAPASVPEGFALVPDAANADEIVTRLYRRFKDWSKRGFGPDDVTWCEVKADVLALLAAPEVAQPAAQGESIDTPEFCDLITELHGAHEEVNPEHSKKAWAALIGHIHQWGASQRQEGRRDMHETSMSVLGENCALVEKLRARDAALIWYRDEAAAIAKNLEADPRAVLASVHVLALDAGTRAIKALATPAPTAGEPSSLTVEVIETACMHDGEGPDQSGTWFNVIITNPSLRPTNERGFPGINKWDRNVYSARSKEGAEWQANAWREFLATQGGKEP
jgi:hypothetical protein